MIAAGRTPPISVETYLAREYEASRRREFVDGCLYTRRDETNQHGRVADNFVVSMHAQLRGKPCQPMNSDAKVRIQLGASTRFYYPDGMVVCEPNPPDDTFQDQPVVIAEVLSDATRRTDQIEKRDAYLTIPSLTAYLLIESDRSSVTVWRRHSEGPGGIEAEVYEGLDSVVPLDEVEGRLPLGGLYARVVFPDHGSGT